MPDTDAFVRWVNGYGEVVAVVRKSAVAAVVKSIADENFSLRYGLDLSPSVDDAELTVLASTLEETHYALDGEPRDDLFVLDISNTQPTSMKGIRTE